MGQKILVTGADGFIGSHLVEALVEEGKDVRALVYYNSLGSWGWLNSAPESVRESIEVVAGDIRDSNFVFDAVAGCHEVMHLAALVAIPYSYHAPQSYVDVNISGTLNVVQAASKLGVSKVVHTSTSEVYGSAQFVPITEDHPVVGQSPYSASKIGADQIALSFWRSFETPVAVVRPFNTYGPRQSARAVIPNIISQIVGGLTEISLGSLAPTRDFSFVDNTVQGMIAVLESDRTLGQVVNIGSGFEVSIQDLVEIIGEIVGIDVKTTLDEQRVRPENSEVDRLLADTTLAQQLTDWRPQYNGREGLIEGLRLTVDWFKDPRNLSHYRIGSYAI